MLYKFRLQFLEFGSQRIKAQVCITPRHQTQLTNQKSITFTAHNALFAPILMPANNFIFCLLNRILIAIILVMSQDHHNREGIIGVILDFTDPIL